MAALIGMAFYAVLIPWHTVSQATMSLAMATNSHQLACHQQATAPNEPDKSNPVKSRTGCPICNGLGTLLLATGAQAYVLVADVAESSLLPQAPDDDFVQGAKIAPQSRSPPTLSS
jgi:hypothetical protein